MNDKTVARKTARVRRFLERIEWMFEINNFERVIYLSERDEKAPDNNDYKVYAKIDFDEVYRTVQVMLYPQFFKLSLDKQRKVLIHELAHSITHGQAILNDQILDGTMVTKTQMRHENERATSKIENLLHGLLSGRYRYAREAYKEYLQTNKKRHGKRKKR